MSTAPAPPPSIYDGIREFAEEYVANPEYRPRFPREPKIVHDALWGTIRLYPWEVAILDLPLFQRLRQISQTSLANYVFPGCRHSRFEHTLGVIHQTQKLGEAVNAQYHPDQRGHRGEPPFDNNTLRNLRLAALFHDCGHSCFSHISENTYRHLPDMVAVTQEGAEYAGCHPHEVLSALILKSDPVRTYLAELQAEYGVEFRVDDAADCILGRSQDKSYTYLAQVINGPFDADKLDYLFRDSHFSGLPLGLDLDRLWASCDKATHPKTGETILTLHQSSVVALEQILFNKINLFTVVYQHPKVRAAECGFQAVIEVIRQGNRCKVAGLRLDRAADFLWLTDSTFFAEALQRPKNHKLHRMIHDILYRRHFLRALTISKDTVKPDKVAFQELRRLNHVSLDALKRRRELATQIWTTAGRPCEPWQVWLDLPPSPTLAGADHTYVRAPSGELRKLTSFFPMNYWNESYMSYKWRGHVFCPGQYQQRVYEAARRVLGDELGLCFDKLAGAASHVPNP